MTEKSKCKLFLRCCSLRTAATSSDHGSPRVWLAMRVATGRFCLLTRIGSSVKAIMACDDGVRGVARSEFY